MHDEHYKGDGVIAGCCRSQEWLLPWWWMHYTVHNVHPVTFIDFGDMSSKARRFCSERGDLISIGDLDNLPQPDKDPSTVYKPQWKSKGVDLKISRAAWFKKPFACLRSPYARTLWIDLDCQIRKSIEPIFEFCENPFAMALGIEPEIVQQFHQQTGALCYGEIEYNTGVIAFKRGCTIIREWSEICLRRNDSFRGDQEALSRMLFENDIRLPLLLPIHNCRAEMKTEVDPKAVIIFHWLGGSKHHIRDQIDLLENKCDMNLSFD